MAPGAEARPLSSWDEGADLRPRLVVGDDGSEAADLVWQWVDGHPWPGWRISVLTARQPPTGPPLGSERADPHPWEPPSPRRLSAPGDVELEHLLAESDPRLALDACRDAALVAIGPRGKGALKHLHIGSTADWLISAHRPLAPVLLVRSATRTRHVIVCVDGSEHARRAVDAVTALPWLGDCVVSVVGVDDIHHSTGEAVAEAAAVLGGVGVADLREQVLTAVPFTAGLDVRSTLLDTIVDTGADLVAVGARGRGGLRGLLVGSVATALVRHAPCSVLVAPTVPEADGAR